MKPSYLIFGAILISCALNLCTNDAHGGEPRRIRLTYSCEITDLPTDASRVDLWMPVPTDTIGQTVRKVEVIRPNGGKIDTEPEYGNQVYHRRFEGPFKNETELGAELRYDVDKTEVMIEEAKSLPRRKYGKPGSELGAYLTANAMIPTDGPAAEIAQTLKLRKDDPVRTARKMYDFLIDTFEYNWKAEGAGRGDVKWACDSKTGDCTDYHSTFLAVCRHKGIPADHQFGFPIPKNKTGGKLIHWHCWAQFWAEGAGWIPVDISEADKHPELKEYNFGSLTPNLIRMAHGRDVTLQPPQQGQPLNIFIFPYVEVDGKEHEGVEWTASFVELEG